MPTRLDTLACGELDSRSYLGAQVAGSTHGMDNLDPKQVIPVIPFNVEIQPLICDYVKIRTLRKKSVSN
jgi:hypothetical protein